MLDIKYITNHLDEVIERLTTRGDNFEYLKDLVKLHEKHLDLIKEVEEKKAFRNAKSKSIGEVKRKGGDASAILAEVALIGDEIKVLDEKVNSLKTEINQTLLIIPNLPALDTPIGKDENDNVVVREVGKVTNFNFEVKDHVDLSESLDILDFSRAVKVSGPRFVIYKGLGARLERSLMNFMMDTHIDSNYVEAIPPYIVNEDSMIGTGQFPKFVEDAFNLKGFNYYLNPTAEVPMINMYRDEIINLDNLPLKYVAFTSAFRSEAGSAGRDTRGILRQHQFQKVELINITKPEDSNEALEAMLNQSAKILDLLKLPYRIVSLSTGDLGFSMQKTYDIEVWIPSQNKYREIASISNAGDFQARRANIRFKRTSDSKTEYVHTLNGSGLAVGRTFVAILENYQKEDGSIEVPEVLVPYMKTNVITKP